MEQLARIATIVRDVVWTAVGVLVLVAVVFVLTGGATGLLPAGLGSGSGSGAGQGANQGGGGSGQTPGNQPGSGGPAPGVQPSAPGPGGQLSVSGSGSFGGVIQGTHVTGNLTVNATSGALGNAGVMFTLQPQGQSAFTFTGHVTCLVGLGTNPATAIVGGNISDSSDPSKMPQGSGFALGVLDDGPDQIAFETGFPVSDPKAICPNEAANMFTSNHPGFPLTSGDITIH
jgi:hypothetical protein